MAQSSPGMIPEEGIIINIETLYVCTIVRILSQPDLE